MAPELQPIEAGSKNTDRRILHHCWVHFSSRLGAFLHLILHPKSPYSPLVGGLLRRGRGSAPRRLSKQTGATQCLRSMTMTCLVDDDKHPIPAELLIE